MLKNVSYNLLETITIVSKSLYRYETYLHDVENSASSRELWMTIKAQRKRIIDALERTKKPDRQWNAGFGIAPLISTSQAASVTPKRLDL